MSAARNHADKEMEDVEKEGISEEDQVDSGEDSEYEESESANGRRKRAKTSTAVVRTTPESVEALRAMLQSTSGPQETEVEVAERANQCAFLQAKAVLAAQEGHLGTALKESGKFLEKVAGGTKIWYTPAGRIVNTTNVNSADAELKTLPGTFFGNKIIDSAVNFFYINKEHDQKAASGFTPIDKPTLTTGKALVAMYKISDQAVNKPSASLTNTGLSQLLNDGNFDMFASVKLFMYTKGLKGHVLPPKVLLLENGAAQGPPTKSHYDEHGVHLCMGELSNSLVVPVDSTKNLKAQFKDMMDVIITSNKIKIFQTELKNAQNVDQERKSLGYNEKPGNAARSAYMSIHNKNKSENPLYVVAVLQALTRVSFDGVGKDMTLNFSVFKKHNSNGLVEAVCSNASAKIKSAKFLQSVIAEANISKPKYTSHTQWVSLSKFEGCIREHKITGIPEGKLLTSAFVIFPGSENYSLSGNGVCTDGDVDNSIKNVLPDTPIISLEDEARAMDDIVNSKDISASLKNGIMATSNLLLTCHRFSSVEYADILTIFREDALTGFDPSRFDLPLGVPDADSDLWVPRKTKVSMLLNFSETNPDDAKETRNLYWLTYQLSNAFGHCKKPEGVHNIVRDFYYDKMKVLTFDDPEKELAAKEERMAEILEVASFIVCTMLRCASLYSGLIVKINQEIVKSNEDIVNARNQRKRLEESHFGSCLNDMCVGGEPVRHTNLTMASFDSRKIFNDKHIKTYFNENKFMERLCVAHTFAKSQDPDAADMQRIIDEVKKNGGPTEDMKLQLEAHFKVLIEKTYTAMPKQNIFGDSDSDEESDSAEADASDEAAAAAASAAAAAAAAASAPAEPAEAAAASAPGEAAASAPAEAAAATAALGDDPGVAAAVAGLAALAGHE